MSEGQSVSQSSILSSRQLEFRAVNNLDLLIVVELEKAPDYHV